VAFSLLASVLAMSTPLIIAHGKLLKTQRDYRLALDELSNHIDRLAGLPEADLEPALAELAPSDFAAEMLPGAALKGNLGKSDLGQHVTLEITWNEPNRIAAPVRLSAWLGSEPSERQEP
jgi:hypothetical protein